MQATHGIHTFLVATIKLILILSIYFKGFIHLFFRERGREGEREREKHHCVVASHVAPTGDLARSPGTCPYWEWNR